MDIEWLECFAEVVKCKSLSKASEHLNISQPAASKQIKKLEEELKVSLFQRTSSGMELTEAGVFFWERIQAVLSELRSIRHELENFYEPKRIRLGTLPSLATYYLPPRILNLRKTGIEVTIQVAHSSEEILECLKSGTVDAVLMEVGTVESFFWSLPVFSEPFYAILPKTHRLSQHHSICLEEIKDEPLVVYPPNCDVRQSITRAYQERGFEAKIDSEVAFGESILSFVAVGVGITFVPQTIADRIGHLSLSAIAVTDFGHSRTIHLVARSERIGKVLYRSFSLV
ncbi:MAG TPA: LysR family transcriptional regulator [Allocoleopsis sp.]